MTTSLDDRIKELEAVLEGLQHAPIWSEEYPDRPALWHWKFTCGWCRAIAETDDGVRHHDACPAAIASRALKATR